MGDAAMHRAADRPHSRPTAQPTVCRSTPNQTAESNGKLAEYEATERQVHEATRVEVHGQHIAHELLLP